MKNHSGPENHRLGAERLSEAGQGGGFDASQPPPKKNPGERDSPLLLPGVHTLELSNAPPSLLKGHTNEMNDQRHQRSHNIKNKLYFKTLWQMSFSAGVHYAPARLQSYLWCLMGSFKNYTY